MGTSLAILIGCLILAAVFILFEVLTISFGLFTLLAVASLAAAVWMGFTISTAAGFLTLALVLLATPVYTYWLVKWLPKTKLGGKLFLKDAAKATNEGAPRAEQWAHLVGRTAIAETTLRPIGIIQIDGQRVHARAESGMIQAGMEVHIVASEGVNVVVRQSS